MIYSKYSLYLKVLLIIVIRIVHIIYLHRADCICVSAILIVLYMQTFRCALLRRAREVVRL